MDTISVVEAARFDKRLRRIVFGVAGYVNYRWGKDITVTHILRSQWQQDQYYSTTPGYLQSPWKSVHQYGRGIDLRSRDFTKEQIAELADWVNENFPYDERNSHSTLIYHNIGLGKHLHLQVAG